MRKVIQFFRRHKTETIFDIVIPVIIIPGLSAVLLYVVTQFGVIHGYLKEFNDVFTLMTFFLVSYVSWQTFKMSRRLGSLLEEEFPPVVSDDNTIFVRSAQHITLPKEKKAKIYRHKQWGEHDKKFARELRHSQWISHTDYHTDDEKVEGGDYEFRRDFNFPYESSWVKQADLYLLVDDECTVSVNGYRLHTVSGFKELHYFYLRDLIRQGSNTLEFNVNNHKSQTFEGAAQNTYGIRYCLSIRYVNKS